jgi:hypothetical protein
MQHGEYPPQWWFSERKQAFNNKVQAHVNNSFLTTALFPWTLETKATLKKRMAEFAWTSVRKADDFCKCKCMIEPEQDQVDEHIGPRDAQPSYVQQLCRLNPDQLASPMLHSPGPLPPLQYGPSSHHALLSNILPLQSSLPLYHSVIKTSHQHWQQQQQYFIKMKKIYHKEQQKQRSVQSS